MSTPKRPPKLAFLTNFVPPTRLATFEFISERIDATFLVDDLSEANRRWKVNTGSLNVEVVPGFTLKKKYWHPAGFSEQAFLHLPVGLTWVLWRLRPTHVISGELGFRTAVACAYRLLRPSTRLTVWTEGTQHTDGPRGAVRRVFRQLLVKVPDAFLACSTDARALLAASGAAPDRIRVSFAASGFTEIGPPPVRTPEQRARLLYAGQFVERKGLRPFMEALIAVCRSLQNRRVEMWFVGYGEEEKWLRDLKVPSCLSLRILPPVQFERMPDFYRQCGIFVFPTLADVWGLVTNEAMAYSMPVLGSRYAASVCDLVEDRRMGWTFVPGDREGTVRAIREALTTPPEQLERMGTLARESVRHITPDRFASDLLHTALGQHGRTS